jgi:hypothetical protein
MKSKTGAFILAMVGLVGAIGCGAGSGSGSANQASAASPSGTAASSSGTAAVPATLAAATSNNTSSSSSFAGTSNGNIAPGNVSKVSFHDLLYPGASTKIYVHVMPWWGESSHINIGYNSADPAEVHLQITDMISRGVDGLILDWYGPQSTQENNALIAIMNEAQQHPGFEFAACEDQGALTGASDVTAKLISDVNYIYSTFEQSPNYMHKNGRPVIVLFGEETLSINWTQVAASVQGNPLFIWQNNGGFTEPQSAGSFSWVGLTGNATDPGLSYLDSFYQTALATTGMQTFGSGYKGFNDSIAPWGSNRLLDQQCGQTWLSTLADISNHYSSGNQLANIQIPTWNDYEEGTEIETGIDNCVSISASVTGQTLSWNISGQENTLHHYAIFATTDGVNLSPVGTVNAGTHSANLGAYSLSKGSYTLYVQAVGQPSILNHMSGPVAYSQ